MADTHRLPAPLIETWEWQLRGSCRQADADLFFHPEGERGPRRAAREVAAKSVCAECPVRIRCREHALQARETYGVWGGLSEHEREAVWLREGRLMPVA